MLKILAFRTFGLLTCALLFGCPDPRLQRVADLQRVANLFATYAAISAGRDHTCAILRSGNSICWGDNSEGAYGNGTTDSSLDGSFTPGISDATGISSGEDYTCAISSGGSLDCWGSNYSGHLGTGTTNPSLVPELVILPFSIGTTTGDPRTVRVVPGPRVTAVSARANRTCALLSNGTIKCWGSGRLGDGKDTGSPSPVDVIGIQSATAVTVGSDHSCALLQDSGVMCWGENNAGQLGTGTMTPASNPTSVPGMQALAIAAGYFHTCAILLDRTMQCWGWNGDGQLGIGTKGPGGNPNPQPVSTIRSATALSAGYNHTCAVLTDGTVRCWGANSSSVGGQLGNGTMIDSPIPVQVTQISNARAVTAGFGHTCALLSDATFKCWGKNDHGQLADGSKKDSVIPVP